MFSKCIVCNSATSIIHQPKFGDYHWCKECDFISKDKAFYATEKQELTNYDYHQNSLEDLKYVEYFNHFIQNAILKYVNTGLKGFDFGSGPTPVLSQILQRDYHFSMDIYDLHYAKDKMFINEKYDLITATEVIEHLADPIPYFELFTDLMNDDSILAIMTLFHQNSEEVFSNWFYIRDVTHISFYTPKTIHYIAQKVGLKVIYTNNLRYITLAKKDYGLEK